LVASIGWSTARLERAAAGGAPVPGTGVASGRKRSSVDTAPPNTSFVSPPSQNQQVSAPQRPLPDAQSKVTGRSGVLAEPPFHIGTGNAGVDLLLALLLYGTLGLGGAVVIVYLVKFFRGSERF